MATKKRRKAKEAVLAAITEHEAAEKNRNMQKIALREFDSVKAICDYVYEKEFCIDRAGKIQAKEEGRDVSEIAEASYNTVRSIVDELVKEGKLQRNGKLFFLSEDFSFERQRFPILDIADKIPIEILRPEDIMFLSPPPQYASAVSDYINAVFYKKDITATVVGDMVMCMSVFPKEAYLNGFKPNPNHSDLFFTKVLGALDDFKLSYRDFPYGDRYALEYLQSHDSDMAFMIEECAQAAARFDGQGFTREFNRKTYEKCKYFISSLVTGEPVSKKFVDEFKLEEPKLYEFVLETLEIELVDE